MGGDHRHRQNIFGKVGRGKGMTGGVLFVVVAEIRDFGVFVLFFSFPFFFFFF